MLQLLNVFSLHGKYFNDDENRFTANVLFLLSESRHRFLQQFFEDLKVSTEVLDIAQTKIIFQPHLSSDSGINIPDAELILDGEVHVLIEAKIGGNLLADEQLKSYANCLERSEAKQKRLVCVTQVNDLAGYRKIISEIEPKILPTGTCVYRQWWQLLDLIRDSMIPTSKVKFSSDQYVLKGNRLDYEERIATLFLREVEHTMYDKKIIDEIQSGQLEDIVVATQDPWFMNVAKRYCVWFPSGGLVHGQRPAKYVAYYETDKEGNEYRKQIVYIAKNKFMWNRITLGDARKVKELQTLFADKKVNDEISSWYKEDETFHVAITDEPQKLKRPIPLGKKNYAQILSKRKYSFVDLVNADTIDDLF